MVIALFFRVCGSDLKCVLIADQFTPGIWPSIYPVGSDEKASSLHGSKSDFKSILAQGIRTKKSVDLQTQRACPELEMFFRFLT